MRRLPMSCAARPAMPESFADLSLLVYLALFAAGLAAGIMNTIAGGGSVITLPVLIFAGLPADVANATNRIGIIAQNIAAVRQFRMNKVREGHLSWRLMLVASVAAVLGAVFATMLPNEDFKKVLGVLLLVLLVLILKQPKPRLLGEDEAPENAWAPLSTVQKAGLLVTFFGLGIYAGFIQAGMGVMILVVLGYFLRMDLVRGNYIKLIVILGLSFVALGTFMLRGVRIDWVAGGVVTAGQVIGAYLGTWVVLRKGATWIKAIMVLAIVGSSAKLLGAFDLIGRLLQ